MISLLHIVPPTFADNETCSLIFYWQDRKGIHERELKSRYCKRCLEELLFFASSSFFTGWFEWAGKTSKGKCSVCEEEIK